MTTPLLRAHPKRSKSALLRSTEQIEVSSCIILFFLLGGDDDCCCLATATSCCSRWRSATATTATTTEFLELLLALFDHFMNGLAFQLVDESLHHVIIALCINCLQDLLDVRRAGALLASKGRHEVGGNILETHSFCLTSAATSSTTPGGCA